MTRQQSARITASLVLGLPSLAAIYGSSASLVTIAGEENLSATWVLPFCLDLLAIGIVVSAVFCGHDDLLSRFTPAAAYAGSAALQVADVWADGPRAWAVHALPLAAAILGTEKILRLWRPPPITHDLTQAAVQVDGVYGRSTRNLQATTAQPAGAAPSENPAGTGPDGREEVDGTPAQPGPLPAPAPVDAPRRKRAPRPSVRRPARQVEADPAVVQKVRAAVHELAVPLDQVTRDQILKHLRSHGPAPHATKVGAALTHLRSTS